MKKASLLAIDKRRQSIDRLFKTKGSYITSKRKEKGTFRSQDSSPLDSIDGERGVSTFRALKRKKLQVDVKKLDSFSQKPSSLTPKIDRPLLVKIV